MPSCLRQPDEVGEQSERAGQEHRRPSGRRESQAGPASRGQPGSHFLRLSIKPRRRVPSSTPAGIRTLSRRRCGSRPGAGTWTPLEDAPQAGALVAALDPKPASNTEARRDGNRSFPSHVAHWRTAVPETAPFHHKPRIPRRRRGAPRAGSPSTLGTLLRRIFYLGQHPRLSSRGAGAKSPVAAASIAEPVVEERALGLERTL